MTKVFIGLIGAIVLLVSSAGTVECANYKPELLSRSEAAATQAQLMKGNRLDLSYIYVTRLQIGDKPVDVISLQPTLLSEEVNGEYWSVSAAGYQNNNSVLVLFSRDPRSGKGYRLTLPAQEIQEGMEFRFPLLHNGDLEGVRVRVNVHIRRP